jgi:multidrug resistance efflux pump
LETEQTIIKTEKIDLKVNVFSIKNTFIEHGNEIEEIISHKPPALVRWGTVYFLLLLMLIALICWFIQYPDIVVAQARLNSVNAPKQVLTRTDGKLLKIAVKENDKVEAGQIMGYMESIANPTLVMEIDKQLNSINDLIRQNRTDEIIQFFPSNSSALGISQEDSKSSIGALGELQMPYQTFIQSFITFKDFLSTGFFLKKKKMLATDMQNIQKLHEILDIQNSLLQQDLALNNENFKMSESLAHDSVISVLDYRNEKSKLIARQLTLPQINASIVSNESLQNEKRKEIAELENQIIVQKNTFIQALLTMKSQIQTWESKYLLKAPVSGTVSFTGFFQESQEMSSGQILFNVVPDNISYYIEMLIPQYNFGKVKQGQEVLLKFQAYPYEQYGSVLGKIEYISNSSTDSGYLAKVVLPYGLMTNYKKNLQCRNGLFAQADIITENMRLLERFYRGYFIK